jgi:hypothetical protein
MGLFDCGGKLAAAAASATVICEGVGSHNNAFRCSRTGISESTVVLMSWRFLSNLTSFFPSVFRGCLVPTQNFFTPSHQMFGHMHRVLNVDEKKLITQLVGNHETNLLSLISP